MKKHIATTGIVPDDRRPKEDGTLPLKLRITFKGRRKYYGTGYDVTPEDWEMIKSKNARGVLKKTVLALAEMEANAQKCCDGIEKFSFPEFERIFFPKATVAKDLQTAFTSYIHDLKSNGQTGTAGCYNCACISIHKFKHKISLEQITPEFLRSYEKWFTSGGKSLTTVGIYIRALRAVLKVAIEDGNMPVENYPFGKRKYVIPTGRNIKKALKLEEIGKFYHYPAQSGSNAERCRDYWIFIYLCNGINVKDMCLLKYGNIENDFITFHRAKTIRTRRSNPEPIRISLKEDAKRIIAKWGQFPKTPDNYIFPCLTRGMDTEEERANIQLLTHLINNNMKAIAAELGINKPVTTYYARHSFATILKNSGVPTEFISEALGHTSLSTTKNYLAGFEQEVIKKTTDILVSFKKEGLNAV